MGRPLVLHRGHAATPWPIGAISQCDGPDHQKLLAKERFDPTNLPCKMAS